MDGKQSRPNYEREKRNINSRPKLKKGDEKDAAVGETVYCSSFSASSRSKRAGNLNWA